MSTLSNLRLKSKLYYYAAHVTAVYDGDTFTVDIDLGLGMWRHGQKIRLWKVNAPELKGADREKGLQTRDFVLGLIQDKDILLRTILDKRGADRTEKFGRLLGEVLVDDEDGTVINLNDRLLEKGLATPMDAGGSQVRVVSRPGGVLPAVPQAIHCPYCGELREVDQEMAIVAQCQNCLAAPFVLSPGAMPAPDV